jgi:hypothetical protein
MDLQWYHEYNHSVGAAAHQLLQNGFLEVKDAQNPIPEFHIRSRPTYCPCPYFLPWNPGGAVTVKPRSSAHTALLNSIYV